MTAWSSALWPWPTAGIASIGVKPEIASHQKGRESRAITEPPGPRRRWRRLTLGSPLPSSQPWPDGTGRYARRDWQRREEGGAPAQVEIAQVRCDEHHDARHPPVCHSGRSESITATARSACPAASIGRKPERTAKVSKASEEWGWQRCRPHLAWADNVACALCRAAL